MNRSCEEDRNLVARCVAGDGRGAEILVRRYSDMVYRSVQYTLTVRHVPFTRYDLEDLHNTVFLNLFERGRRRLAQYQGRNGCSLASWIRLITVRTVLDHLREKGVDALSWQQRKTPLERLPELAAEGTESRTGAGKEEWERLVQIGLEKLPPRDRLFMKLHFDEGLSIAEVAETMQLSVDHAYTIKHRAIARLKSRIASTPASNS